MKREIKVGLFMLLVLAGLYWGINFLRGRDIFSLSNTYYAQYDQVNGVQKTAAVMIKGVKVGVVSDIVYDPKNSQKVTLEFTIGSKFHIPDNSQARIYSSGIMEGKAVEIVPGNSPVYLKHRDTLHAYTDPGLLEVAGSEFGDLMTKVSQLADNASRLMTTVNALVDENRAALGSMVDNVEGITASLNYVVANDSENLRRIIDNLDSFSGALARNAGSLDATLGNMERFSGSLAAVDPARLDRSLAQLDSVLTGINAGRGTMGKMVVSDSLYNSLTRASDDLALLLEDIRANPGRYVSVSVFGRRQK